MGPGAGMPMGPGGHTFKDLVESDHAEFDLSDAAGAAVLSFDLDYITADSSALSGYATLGVSGGDGKMLSGDAAAIVYASTSLDRDLNACGYSSYTTNSPATDSTYTPNAATPDWDYRVVYDVWPSSRPRSPPASGRPRFPRARVAGQAQRHAPRDAGSVPASLRQLHQRRLRRRLHLRRRGLSRQRELHR